MWMSVPQIDVECVFTNTASSAQFGKGVSTRLKPPFSGLVFFQAIIVVGKFSMLLTCLSVKAPFDNSL
jgi:hypothetical protein